MKSTESKDGDDGRLVRILIVMVEELRARIANLEATVGTLASLQSGALPSVLTAIFAAIGADTRSAWVSKDVLAAAARLLSEAPDVAFGSLDDQAVCAEVRKVAGSLLRAISGELTREDASQRRGHLRLVPDDEPPASA